jgi:dTDP-4-amino-4,6-dideoxygalactose transaminase
MSSEMIPFNRPFLTGREQALVAEAIASRLWSGDGPMTRRATALLEATTEAPRALLTTSCTHALEMAALLLDVAPGDEVIVPAFTFVSTANAFAMRGARIVFVDVRPDTLNLDERLLERAVSARTRAIVPVHYAGVACAMDAIAAIAERAGASVVEDNAHGLFGRWRGRPLGTLGRLAVQSFHETKNVSCGEGGALLLNDTTLLERAEIVREKGTNRSRFFRGEIDKYTWVDLGSSWLPSDLLAAFLVGQLEDGARIQAARHRVWSAYANGLADWGERHGVALPQVPDGCEHPAHLFYLLLPDLERREALLAFLRARGVHAVSHYQPLHLSEFGRRWGGRRGDCPVTERAAETVVRLPLHAGLGDGELERILDAVRAFRP